MADAPIPVGVRNRPFAVNAGPGMAEAVEAAKHASLAGKQARALELRKVCMAYAMKVSETNAEATAESIIADAGRFYAFFAEDGDD